MKWVSHRLSVRAVGPTRTPAKRWKTGSSATYARWRRRRPPTITNPTTSRTIVTIPQSVPSRAEPVWVPVAPNVTGVTVPHAATPWQIPVAVTIYRKKVAHRATKNYQLDLFDPNDGHYEYSAVTSNLGLTVRNLWFFACGRGNHEKTIAQLKSGLAFHSVPTQAYAANSAWQQLVALAHNLLTNFQIETGADQRRRSRKHTVLPRLADSTGHHAHGTARKRRCAAAP